MSSSIFEKTYLAVVSGHLKENKGIINAPISRKENSIIEREVSEKGQVAITHYEVLQKFENYSLVECSLETGRTHQIRVHMAYIGNHLLGDSLYGYNNQNLINRHALHSFKMKFIHPISKEKICLEAPIPKDIKKLISQ